MSRKSFIEKMKVVLENDLAETRGIIDKLAEDLKIPESKNEEEAADQLTQMHNSDSLKKTKVLKLTQIEGALFRIDQGEYGSCFSCGEDIMEKRLEALPYVSKCRECAEEEELDRRRGNR